MPITSVTSDAATLTMTAVGEYPCSVERLWNAWVDPRQVERFWGPPEWPATFTRHDMVLGGRSEYFMTGPDGEKSSGYWVVEAIEPQRRFVTRDGFADDDGAANDEMPSTTMEITFESTGDGSRFMLVTTFPSIEAMEQLVAMGMVEGATAAFGQMDAVLADLKSFAAGALDLAELDDTRVRASRVIRGTVEEVWQAHHDAELIRQWMLGPDGWTMPVCEPAVEVGDSYHYGWESDDGENAFGFEGSLLEADPPQRSVTTERMAGTDGPSTRNEMTLHPVDGGTLLTLVITYPSKELRYQILATGMADGMEASYARLESAITS